MQQKLTTISNNMTYEIIDRKDSRNHDELISDERIREILARFSPILQKGIADANTFFRHSIGEKLANTVPLTVEEAELWQKHYQIVDRTLKARNTLFVPVLSTDDQSLLEPSEYTPDSRSQNKQIALRGSVGRKYRVNLDEVVHVPVQPAEPRNMRFLIKLHAHLGGMGSSYGGGKNSLYNAFIGFDTFIQDEYGRWILKSIPGTTPGVDGPNWGDGPVYSPYMPARASLWFNTHIDQRKPNTIGNNGESQFDQMFHCEIHHPELLGQLNVPKDKKLKFFFWQLNAFVKNPSLGNSLSFPMLTEGR